MSIVLILYWGFGESISIYKNIHLYEEQIGMTHIKLVRLWIKDDFVRGERALVAMNSFLPLIQR
jgi:hypothetical protein